MKNEINFASPKDDSLQHKIDNVKENTDIIHKMCKELNERHLEWQKIRSLRRQLNLK